MHPPLIVEFTVISAYSVMVFASHLPYACDQREYLDSGFSVKLGGFHAFLMTYQWICVDSGFVMGGLGAPFAIFRAFARTGVDYGAGIECLVTKCFCDFFSRVP